MLTPDGPVRALMVTLLLPTLVGAAPILRAQHDDAHVQRPTFAPGGERLAYEANDHLTKRVSLFVGAAEAGPFTRVLPSAVGASGLTAGFATASTDPPVVGELSWAPASVGTFVYAASDGVDSDLYIERGGPVATHPAPDGGPAWSPSGTQVVFTSGRTGEGDLYVVDLARLSEPPRQLTSIPTASEVYAAWSPDSRAVAFVAHGDGGDHLWLLPNLDGHPVQLTRWPGVQTRPSYSPDGRWIAFYANPDADDRFDLYALRPLHLAEPVLLLPGVVPNAAGPVWTPDGRYVLAVADDDDAYDPVVAVPVDDPTRPVVLDLGTVGHGDLDVARGPDGQVRIAVAAQGRAGDDERGFRRLFVTTLPALP